MKENAGAERLLAGMVVVQIPVLDSSSEAERSEDPVAVAEDVVGVAGGPGQAEIAKAGLAGGADRRPDVRPWRQHEIGESKRGRVAEGQRCEQDFRIDVHTGLYMRTKEGDV